MVNFLCQQGKAMVPSYSVKQQSRCCCGGFKEPIATKVGPAVPPPPDPTSLPVPTSLHHSVFQWSHSLTYSLPSDDPPPGRGSPLWACPPVSCHRSSPPVRCRFMRLRAMFTGLCIPRGWCTIWPKQVTPVMRMKMTQAPIQCVSDCRMSLLPCHANTSKGISKKD